MAASPAWAATGDIDGNGEVSLADFALLQSCISGPNQPTPGGGCSLATFDADSDVDLLDYAVFQRQFGFGVGAPKIISITPSPAEWTVDDSGLAAVHVVFSEPVIMPQFPVRAWTLRGGAITTFAWGYDDASSTLTIGFSPAIQQDQLTLLIDYTIMDALGTELDGEIASPANPSLPSGDGVRGGQAVFRYRILQGDANRDGQVNETDKAIVRASLRLCVGSPAFDPRADLNHDGCVNFRDSRIVRNGLGRTLPQTDGVAPTVASRTPTPGITLRAFDLSTAQIGLSEGLRAESLTPTSLHVLLQNGLLRPATAFSVTGQDVTFAFNPPLESNSTLEFRLSNGVADSSGELLVLEPRGAWKASVDSTASTIVGTSPVNGEQGVTITRESIIDFRDSLSAIQAGAFSVTAASQPVNGFHDVSGNGKRVWYFYGGLLPGSTQITVTVDGSKLLDDLGNMVDADGDGQPGGMYQFSFNTVNLTSVLGTRTCGRIFDSELGPGSTEIPLQGVTITVDGRPDLTTQTDKLGNYELVDIPVGDFFVHIDGSTEVHSQGVDGPLDYYYPTLGKPFHGIVAGDNNVMPFNNYLPKVKKADVLTNIDPSQQITITSSDPRLAGIEIVVPPDSLFRDDGMPATFVGVGAVPSDRLPAPLPPGVSPPIVFTFQSDASNLRTPASVRFPNLENLPPGTKSALWSFNHDTGHFELAGAMTVDATATFITTDAGAGIPAPGWHFTQPGTSGSGGPPRGGCQTECGCTRRPAPTRDIIYDAAKAARECAKDLSKIAAAVDCLIQMVERAEALYDAALEAYNSLRSSEPWSRERALAVLHTLQESKKTVEVLFECFLQQSPLEKARSIVACLIAILENVENVCKDVTEPPPGCSPPLWQKIVCTGVDIVKSLLDAAKTAADTIEALLKRNVVDLACGTIDAIEGILDPTLAARNGGTPLSVEERAQIIAQLEILLSTREDFRVMGFESVTLKSRLEETSLIHDSWLTDSSRDINLHNQPLASEVHFLIEANGTMFRGRSNHNGIFSAILAPGVDYFLAVYEPLENKFASIRGITAASGVRTIFHALLLNDATSLPDGDADGLADDVELVLNTPPDNPDCDNDGVVDGAEVSIGSNPCGNSLAATGIVGAVDTPGFAHEVCVANDLAMVADGDAGVSIFNIFQTMSPALVVRVDTPGTAVDVDCEGGDRVAVADADAGLAIVDITIPAGAFISHQVALPGNAQARCVSVTLGTAYVGDNQGRVHLIDMVTGEILGSRTLAAGVLVDDLGISGTTLFALTTAATGTGGTLYSLNLLDSPPTVLSQINSTQSNERTGPFPRRRMFVGVNRALVNEFGGVIAYNTTNPAAMIQLCSDVRLAAVRGLVEDGSGNIILAGGSSTNANCQVYGQFPPRCPDPTPTGNFRFEYPTPGNAHGVGMNNGLVYLADGASGMQVVNIISTDVQRIPPTVTLATPNLAAATVEEGKAIVARADAVDDVQMRHVEFYVNGVRDYRDGNYPYEYRFAAPRLAQQSSVAVRALAVDTGGNQTWSDEIVLTITPDETPPRVVRVTPVAEDIPMPDTVSLLTVRFDEDINPATLNIELLTPGPDGILTTGDDLPLGGMTVTYNADSRTAFLVPPFPLPAGVWHGQVAHFEDVLGNAGDPFDWYFSTRTEQKTFTANATIACDDMTREDYDVIVSGATLTVDCEHFFNSLSVVNDGTVAHATAQPIGLRIESTNYVTVEVGSRISATGRGYASGQGPGAGGVINGSPYSSATGGGYGGAGGQGDRGRSGGGTYGSIEMPTEFGSGGGRAGDYVAGGRGGGAIQLTVGGNLRVDGVLDASGGNGSGSVGNGGGGSGGSILVTAGRLEGQGSISANGGNARNDGGSAGGGGGGRIALYYDESLFTGVIGSCGGTGFQSGCPGTVFPAGLANATCPPRTGCAP